jgi:threonine aldolase
MSSSIIPPSRGFASDNYAGVLPEVLSAIISANSEGPLVQAHEGAYGGDKITEQILSRLIKRHFGVKAVAFPVFNGTAANVISLLACCPRHSPAIICAESAHIQCDEGGAPEVTAGLKLHTLKTERDDGKLTPKIVQSAIFDRDSVHRSQPGCVSISNTTELGTVYTAAEIKALADIAHENGMLLHLDGARISNAAAALGQSFRSFTTDVGVDVVSFGGTKIGAMGAEAIIVLNDSLLPALPFLRKTSMQLASKQRFASAQLCALLEPANKEMIEMNDDDVVIAGIKPCPTPLCVKYALHANAMAARLLEGVTLIPTIRLPELHSSDIRANAIFPFLPKNVTSRLHKNGWRFYIWAHTTGQVRFMCSWDTQESDVTSLLLALKDEMKKEEGITIN